MAFGFVLIGKSVAIAVVAALVAWLPMAVLVTWDMDLELRVPTAIRLLSVSLLGTLAIGLPVTLLTYFLARKELEKSFKTVLLTANLAGIVMLLVTTVLGNLFGGFVFGIPSILAANTFAVLGWFWIIKPHRKTFHA